MERTRLLITLAAITVTGCSGGGGSPVSNPRTPAPSSSPASTPTPSATATPTLSAQVSADALAVGNSINRDQFGANMSVGFDITNPTGQATSLSSVGVGLIRIPGGSPADDYHWQTNTWSASPCVSYGPPSPNNTFDGFEGTLLGPGGFDTAITVNYGSNPSCSGPADPTEAAAWVAYALTKEYPVKYWTIGNEVYGSYETDLHNPGSHDPSAYASNVASQFYPLMKAQNPAAQIGVVLAGTYNPTWDTTVLAAAKYDFVEIHFYPENSGSENDTTLLQNGPTLAGADFSLVQSELKAAGRSTTPILLGEFNSPNSNPGKQTLSIVNALFIGMMEGEILKYGIQATTIEDGYFGECNGSGDVASTIYGWQNFGTYSLFSGGFPNASCPGAETIPAGTPLPIARALALASQFAQPGNHMLATTVAASLSTVRAYSAQKGSGYSFMLFNLDPNNPVTFTLGLSNTAQSSFSATVTTYGKAQYDLSESGVWAGPVSTSLGSITNPASITLPQWSMSGVELSSAGGATARHR